MRQGAYVLPGNPSSATYRDSAGKQLCGVHTGSCTKLTNFDPPGGEPNNVRRSVFSGGEGAQQGYPITHSTEVGDR